MKRYLILNDDNLYFNGYRYSAAKYNNIPNWDVEFACVFFSREEAEECQQELQIGRIVEIVITP